MHGKRHVTITIHGRLSARLAATFDGLTPTWLPGRTTLAGDVADQVALHGLLEGIRNLGLELESVLTGSATSNCDTEGQ